MRACLEEEDEEMIESGNRFAKSNCRLSKNCSIKMLALEKCLSFNHSLLLSKLVMCHLTDLQSCHDRQLASIGGIVEELVRRDRKAIKLITKVTPNWECHLSTAFGITEKYCRGEERNLAGTGQGNCFSGDVYWSILCSIISAIEKENAGMKVKSNMMSAEEEITAVLFADNAGIIDKGDKAIEKLN